MPRLSAEQETGELNAGQDIKTLCIRMLCLTETAVEWTMNSDADTTVLYRQCGGFQSRAFNSWKSLFITEKKKKSLLNINTVQHPLHLVILLAVFLTVHSIAMVINFYADLRLAIFIAGCSIHSFSKIGTTILLCFTVP